MITIPNTLPRPAARPLDLVQAGKTAARILRARVETDTLSEGDFAHFMDRIEKALAAAVELGQALDQGVAKPARTARNEPFSVIDGGRS